MVPPATAGNTRSLSGFSLLEMAIVLAIIGVIIGSGLAVLSAGVQSSQYNATVDRMDAIHQALLDYSTNFYRLPCPASLTLATSNTNYGVEAASNSNSCYGGTPAANYQSSSGAVEGAVPVRTLKLPDSYMYDSWGHKFRYAVDPSQTAANSFPPPSGMPQCVGNSALTVKDATGAIRSSSAAYVLLSHGNNGHGGYTKNGVAFSAGITATDELKNCHCNSSGVYASPYDATYVQKMPTNSTTLTDVFDDIVSYRDAWQLQNPNTPLAASSCYYIAIMDYGDASMLMFDSQGNFKWRKTAYPETVTTFGGGKGVAIDNNQIVWGADGNNHRSVRYYINGSYKDSIAHTAGGGAEQSIIVNPVNNHVFVSDGSTANAPVWEGSNSGASVQSIGGSTLNYANVGGFDSTGAYLWVADTGNNRIVKYTISGGAQTQVIPSSCTTSCAASSASGQFNTPTDVKLDASGNIWVADSGNNRVIEFDPTGASVTQTITTWTTTGAQTFSGPHGLGFDPGGRLWVADYGNDRIVGLKPSGSSFTYSATIPTNCAAATSCPGGYNTDGQLGGPYYISISSR